MSDRNQIKRTHCSNVWLKKCFIISLAPSETKWFISRGCPSKVESFMNCSFNTSIALTWFWSSLPAPFSWVLPVFRCKQLIKSHALTDIVFGQSDKAIATRCSWVVWVGDILGESEVILLYVKRDVWNGQHLILYNVSFLECDFIGNMIWITIDQHWP